MTLQSTCAIVLKVAEHGEADKLVTCYSRELGRITGLAKGAKRSARRFVNKLEEFSLLQLFYRSPRSPSGLTFIGEAELLRAHLSLRTVYPRYVAAAYLGELTLRFTRDNDPDRRIFSLLQWALDALDRGEAAAKTAALFHLRLLDATGYRPELHRCGHCGQPVGPGRSFLLLPGTGSLLCSVCQPSPAAPGSRLSVQTLKFLAQAQRAGQDRVNRLQMPERSAGEALEALYRYTLHLLQQDIHSWKCLRVLLAEPSLRPCPTPRRGGTERA